MRKLKICVLFLLICFFCAFSIKATPRQVQFKPIGIPQTGQLKSYHPGDDGDLRKGVKWPSPRFINNHNGTITDSLTGLMWETYPSRKAVDWDGAFNRISEINKKKLGGHFDWRLPNINELLSIASFGNHPAFKMLRIKGYIGQVKEKCYFYSSTTENLPTINEPPAALGVYLYNTCMMRNIKLERVFIAIPPNHFEYHKIIGVRTAGRGGHYTAKNRPN